MNTVGNDIAFGLIFFVILLVVIHIMKLYTDTANIIGGKIISFLRCLLHKIIKK